jgi:amino acid transporter
VIAAHRAGIKVVPSIINAVVLTSAWSSGNANMLGGPRILFALAKHGHAPKFFTKLNRFGVPYIAISFFGVFMCLSYMTFSDTASTVFTWLQDLVAISTLVNWTIICITYLRFYYACKAQGIDRHTELPWAAPFQPWSTWISLVMFIIFFFTGGYKTFIHGHWDDETFISNYLNLPVIVGMYFIYKYVKKTKLVPLKEAPIRGFVEIYRANPEPLPKPKQGIHKFNILWG